LNNLWGWVIKEFISAVAQENVILIHTRKHTQDHKFLVILTQVAEDWHGIRNAVWSMKSTLVLAMLNLKCMLVVVRW